ncbi:hypothetical protein RJT34_22594 [Clitoria ternatea]|uniref:GTD-binding domain-containing protein n=1 Tax=Clitoria ternatea TaxID=43366 RepID=A0AAN9FKZ7_CLITE
MQGFTALLTSAACEWFLIFLLLLDALLSYLLTKFASYCQLELPCLLCSRLDHMFGCGNKPEFYQNLFCSNHKSEISSLILCHAHGKLGNGHRMCDDCLLSVTANARSNSKTHRLLVGKFGLVLGGSGFQSSSLSRDLFTGSKGSRACTCCGRLWKPELKSPGRAILKPCIPLPHAPRQRRLNHLRKTRDKFTGSEGKNYFNPISHVGHTELWLNSDSESEFPFSDDDDASSVFHENIEDSNNSIAQNTSVPSSNCIPADLNPPKPNASSDEPAPSPSESDQCVEPNVSKDQDMNANCPVEINLLQANQKCLSSDLLHGLILPDDVSPSPIVMNVQNGESESKDSTQVTCLSQDSVVAPLSELITFNGSNANVGASSEKSADAAQESDAGIISEKNGEVLKKIDTREKESAEADPMVSDSAPTYPTQENSSYLNKSSVPEERHVPGFVIEQPTIQEVDIVKEDMEQSSSYNSPHYVSNMSQVVPLDDVQSPEDSCSNGIQVIHKSASVESCLESMDESIITEIEGESITDRLKRQSEYYKKCMDVLQKELEEERNASAIATNEAMSMITRLQEEKAALQMEALQYLRMMEEQAEYDNDELEKVNDLLTDKEKEIQDLEAELEFYRANSEDEPMVHPMQKESWDSRGENVTVQKAGLNDITNLVSKFPDSKSTEVSKIGHEAEIDETSILEFEEEKRYILQCLRNLEKKLHQIYCDEISCHRLNSKPEKHQVCKLNQQGASNGEGPQLLHGHEETDLSKQKNDNVSNGNHSDKDGSDGDDCSLGVENNHSTRSGPQSSSPRREVELVALENEISDLNERLEALEFDHDLLEHIINSLENGNDGKQFIQDIAHRLRELRKIGIR